MVLKVAGGGPQEFGVIEEMTKTFVTPRAQQTADVTSLVAMVYYQFSRHSAHGASTLLILYHFIERVQT